MKKQRILLFCLFLALAVPLTGCANLFAAEYSYTAPFAANASPTSGDAREISNYNMLKSALVELISAHTERATFRFSRYNGSVSDDLAEAGLEIKTTNPLGAYAVESVSFDTSRIVSYYMADVLIVYKKTAEEIQRIVGISGSTELEQWLLGVVANQMDETVIRIYSAQVNEDSIVDIVERLHYADPVTVVTAPTVTVDTYPNEGISHIYDIQLAYRADAERLREMSATLYNRVLERVSGIQADSEPLLALAAARDLSVIQRMDMPGNFANTAWGALVAGAADSQGIALGYKALCNALGLECLVVKGSNGDMGAEEHFWNILGLYGDYYHVDVSSFAGEEEAVFLANDEEMWGNYIWDTEAYPNCTGALRYSDLVPAPEEPPVETPPLATETPASTETHPPATATEPPTITEPEFPQEPFPNVIPQTLPPQETDSPIPPETEPPSTVPPEETIEPEDSPPPEETDSPVPPTPTQPLVTDAPPSPSPPEAEDGSGQNPDENDAGPEEKP